MKTTGGLAWPCGAPSRTLAAPCSAVAEACYVGLRPPYSRATIARLLGRWPWTAFAASCSTAGYVFLYSVRHTAGCACARASSRAQHPRLSCAGLLLFRQDEDVRLLSDSLLLRIQCAAPARELVRPRPRVDAMPLTRAPATAVSIFCVALGVMCGTLGYCGCSVFVRRIYVNIKSD